MEDIREKEERARRVRGRRRDDSSEAENERENGEYLGVRNTAYISCEGLSTPSYKGKSDDGEVC